MPVAVVHSAGLHGIDAFLVRVEVDLAGGQLPGWQLVGLPEKAVVESKDRVLTALRNAGYPIPSQKITINLSPASTKKDGTSLDLAMAIGLLVSQGFVPLQALEQRLFLGELSLNGEVKGVNGVLASALLAKQLKLREIFVPEPNASEAAVVEGLTVYAVSELQQVFAHFKEPCLTPYPRDAIILFSTPSRHGDFKEVRGQYHAKRALEIAAAGAHNILLVGPPGTGKSLLCQRLPTILPPLSFEETLETTKIYSSAGHLKKGQGLMMERPFRSPHHSVSDAGLIGGRSFPQPGEASLAHYGVLFLDEFPEFKRHVLELLRQPLEEGRVTISRAYGSVEFPARFLLAAAMNPCPCGYLGHVTRPCVCTPRQIRDYQNHLSGPLLDRIDLHVELAPVPSDELMGKNERAEPSRKIRERVCRAREIAGERFRGERFHVNAHMDLVAIERFCRLDEAIKRQVATLIASERLSARSYHRMLKVARTIADLAARGEIVLDDVLEAYQYRCLGI